PADAGGAPDARHPCHHRRGCDRLPRSLRRHRGGAGCRPGAHRPLPQGRARRPRRAQQGAQRPWLRQAAAAGAGDDRRRQPRQPGDLAATRRQRPGAQADRGAPAGDQGAVPAAPVAPAGLARAAAVSDAGLRLEPSWKARVGGWFEREDMRSLSAFLRQRKAAGVRIYPPGPRIVAVFEATPFPAVKVVVLGQDPYHGHGQAHGLCFSVSPGVPVPPSLRNMYKELERDLGIAPAEHGWLMPWARQGVLLLNAVLTVEEGRAGSHQGKGWEGFTDHVVDVLNREREGLVFMLWGSYAQAKG